jgi:hypothetical protein
MYDYYNDVNDWLTVGGDIDLARDVTGQSYQVTIDELIAHGVTHVLDVRSEWEDREVWLDSGLPASHYRHAPIIDSWHHIPPESWFIAVETFVRRFWLDSVEGDRIYIHCHMGINRAPSASMLALLTVNPELDPWDAFLQIRKARPVAGLVYASAVGIRHILNVEGIDDLSGGLPESATAYSKAIRDYWTPERQAERRAGISYYRSNEGGTLVVDELAIS